MTTKSIRISPYRAQRILAAAFLAAALGSACTNAGLSSLLSSANSSSSTTSTTTTATTDTYVISNVNVTASGQNSGAAYTVNIFFDSTKSTAPVTNHCNTSTDSSQTSKPCVCEFDWTEINTTGGTQIPIARSVQTSVSTAQSAFVTCDAPGVYSTEILDGTVLHIKVVGGASNPDQSLFTVTPFSYTKNSSTVTGSFQDSLGNNFDNVLHYSCYEQFKRGMQIQSKLQQLTSSYSDTAGVSATFPLASQFCVQTIKGGATSSTSCPGILPPTNSAQANYYDLYIRTSERGDINQGNDGYVCPMVKESLNSTGTTSTSGDFWPLDTSFALSMAPTATFPIGITAFTKTSNASDPTAVNSTCSTTGTQQSQGGGGGNFNSLIQSCLGFAAQPNSDGTCPYFKDSQSKLRLTYRLRKYVALYPPVYDTNGSISGNPQPMNVIYVLDRPITGSSDPLKPYTMRGPKPCPFSYFDSKGVTGVTDAAYASNLLPTYAATNNPAWTGTNIDGVQFPNTDSSVSSALSCSTVFPILDPTKTYMSLLTVNKNNANLNQVYVRPVRAWAPHYEEDTSFQACAPQAYPNVVDPPLHIARDASSGNVSWCEEGYPTQNDNIPALDPKPATGHVLPYTSPVVKNSDSAQCTATVPSTIPGAYAAGGYARHGGTVTVDNGVTDAHTCDRTVVNVTSGWNLFPLLARPSQIEAAITGDSTYQCSITYDNANGKTGVATPSGGCCAAPSTSVPTGTANNSTAHLEPDMPCLTPAY